MESLGASHRCLSALFDRLEQLLGRDGDQRQLQPQFGSVATEFDEALDKHLQDEECDVFPALLATASSPDRREQAYALVSRLLVEHREMTEIWSRLRVALRARSAGLAGPPYQEDARAFIEICRRHLELEDREFGDLMQAVPRPRLESMAQSIARRHAPAEIEGGSATDDPSGAAPH